MKLGSFLAVLVVTGFLFLAILRLHPVGEPLGNPDALLMRSAAVTDIDNTSTIDDYYLRNGQRETGSNNIVTSIVFDYRAFDTLGEAAVLFIVVSAVSMLVYTIKKAKRITESEISTPEEYPIYLSRIVSFGAFLMYPLIIIFGIYLVIHGHLSPGGGFQGGAVMASGTALLLISAIITRNLQKTKNIFSFFESVGLTIFISIGFAGIGVSFLYNFLAAGGYGFFDTAIAFGPNTGFLNSAGILPILSVAVGLEVFCGLSIILLSLYYMARPEKQAGSKLR